MKAALFTDSYLPNTDGVVSSILALRKGMRQQGHDFTIFAPDAPGYVDAPDDEVLRFAAMKFPPYPQYRAAIFPYAISASTAKKHKLSLVHSKAMATMAIAAYRFARRSRVPCMASVETMIPDGVHYLSKNSHVQALGRQFAWSYLKWLYSHFDLVTAPSLHTRSVLSSHGIEATVLPSPIDAGRFKPSPKWGQEARRSLGVKKGEKLVLSVGRVVREKNYGFLLSAAKKMRDPSVKFVFVGSGPYLEGLRKEAVSLGVAKQIVFAGFVPDFRLVSYFNAADAFVSSSKFETQGLALLEAFACGKPAAVMKGTPMEEVVSAGRNGYVFQDDQADCAEKLRKCLQNSKKFAGAARKKALEYSIPAVTGRLLDLYGRLLE
jgi:1,2-diacylglycerol 3-alpha-glucosyltransferase